METEETMEGTMGRPERHDVDYFPFFVKRGRTLNILESKYGLEGIGFFTNLLRFLSVTPDHHYCIRDESDKMNFFAEVGIKDESRGIEMIDLMVKTAKFDKDLWENYKVIASDAFLLSLKPAYDQRKNNIITMDEIRSKFVSMYGNEVNRHGNPFSSNGNPEKDGHNPQSKVKKSKVKKSKEDMEATPPVVSETSSSAKTEKTKKAPLREREPVNDMERIEKVYLKNWDMLFSQGRVQTPEPVITWGQTRSLLKTHLEKLQPEQIIQALNNGLSDIRVMNGGYSLSFMLTGWMLNQLLNGNSSGPSRHRIAADHVSDVDEYFK